MVRVRNYIAGEWLPWTQEEIGYAPELLDPAVCWVVFVDCEMQALLVGAKVMGTLWLVRLLSNPRRAEGPVLWWLRPLWMAVRDACGNQRLAGFWVYMENKRDAERKMIALLRQGRAAPAILTRPAEGLWISGRFQEE